MNEHTHTLSHFLSHTHTVSLSLTHTHIYTYTHTGFRLLLALGKLSHSNTSALDLLKSLSLNMHYNVTLEETPAAKNRS